MPDTAMRGRTVRQRWALPGSRHDLLVRWSKVALPSIVGVLIAVLALAPLDKKGDVSFILDKNKVDSAPERMRVEAARYVGADNRGQPFQITAQRAIQRSSDLPIVDISGMFARLGLSGGPLLMAANDARYDLDAQTVRIDGPIRVQGPDGYRLETRDVKVDLKRRHLESSGAVSGQMRLGSFQARHLSADLGERTVTLSGGARLKIVQGAVR